MTGSIVTQLKTLARRTAIASPGTVARLRLAFLVPLAGTSTILFGIRITMLYTHERGMVEGKDDICFKPVKKYPRIERVLAEFSDGWISEFRNKRKLSVNEQHNA